MRSPADTLRRSLAAKRSSILILQAAIPKPSNNPINFVMDKMPPKPNIKLKILSSKPSKPYSNE